MTEDKSLDGRLAEVERKVQTLVDVCSAVADDTLRMCFALDEVARAGKLPTVPWDIATAMVELHHAQQAAKADMVADNGVTAAQQVEHLKSEVIRLRTEYLKSLSAGT